MKSSVSHLVVPALVAFVQAVPAAAASSDDYKLGLKALESGDPQTALRFLETAREKEPLDADLLRALGRAHAGIGGHEIPAIVHLRAAGKSTSANLEDEILALQSKLEVSVDNMLSAAVEGFEALSPDDRLAVGHHLVEALARADRLEKVSRVARRVPDGWATTAAVARVAVDRARANRTTDAGRLFDLAREIAEDDVFAKYGQAYEAVMPPVSNDPRALAEYEKRQAETEERHRQIRARVESESRRVCSGVNWMYLALIEDQAGFRGRAKRDWDAGMSRYLTNSGRGMPPGSPAKLMELTPGRLLCYGNCNVENAKKPEGGSDPAPAAGAPRIAWKDVLAGHGPFDPKDAKLADISESLDRLAHTSSGRDAPKDLAQYASRVAEASWFLKNNRPR